MDLLLTILAIPTVSLIAYFFGRNPFRWAIYAYLLEFWVLIPLFLMKKKPTPPIPNWINSLATEIHLKRELRKIKSPNDLTDLAS
jgi:hypothetical protein